MSRDRSIKLSIVYLAACPTRTLIVPRPGKADTLALFADRPDIVFGTGGLDADT